MSLGNTYDNNKRTNGPFDPTVYSPYKMNNAEGTVDQTCISFSFWNNSLKISISPKKATTGADNHPVFDYENGIAIYINHTKARILAEELKNFLSDPVTYDNCGVPSGQSLITVSRGTQFDSPTPVIIIRRINENGAVESSFAYQTKADYHFAVRNYNEDGTFEKALDDYKYLEIQQIVTILEEFYKATTSAVAYTVLDQFKWEHNRQREWRNSISAKLGIEVPTSGGGSSRNFSSTSYFNSSSGNKSSNSMPSTGVTRTATLDDID